MTAGAVFCSVVVGGCSHREGVNELKEVPKEIKSEVIKFLEKAEVAKKDKDIHKAMDVLLDAKQFLKNELHIERQTVENITQGGANPESYYDCRVANILYQIQEYDQALGWYEKVVEHLPNNNQAYRAKGDCLRNLGRYEEALADYREGIRVRQESEIGSLNDKTTLHNSMGLVYLKLGNYEEAIASFDEAIDDDEENALYHCNRGIALYRNGDRDRGLDSLFEAQKLFKKAEKLSRGNLIYISTKLDELVLKLGNIEEPEQYNAGTYEIADAFVEKFCHSDIDPDEDMFIEVSGMDDSFEEK